MKHTLTIGYLGKDYPSKLDKNIITSVPDKNEPEKSISDILKKFNIKEFRVEVTNVPKVKHLEKLTAASDFKTLTAILQEMKNSDKLPMVFDILAKDVEVEIVSCETTIVIISEDFNKLSELEQKFKTEQRCNPYGFDKISLK